MRVFAFILIAVIVACSNEELSSVHLVDGIRSQQTITSFQAQFPYAVLKTGINLKGITTFEINSFQYKGFSGLLKVNFYNDALMSVIFYPDSRAEIFVKEYQGLNNVEGNVKIHSAMDFEKNIYLKISDLKLESAFEKVALD